VDRHLQPDPNPEDPALHRAVDDECLRLSYEHLPSVTLATSLAVGVLAVLMLPHVPVAVLAAWVALYLAVTLVRVQISLWYRREARSGEALRQRLPALTLGLVLAPLAWSALPFLTPAEDTTAHLVQLLFAGGLIAGGAQTLIGTPRILFVNTLLTLGPLAGRLLSSGIDEQAVMGALAVFYFGCNLYFGRRNLALIRESIALRLRNQRLVDALTEARDQAEQARDAAERARDAKNRFLAAASHDIRQPLHAAQLFVGALATGAQPGERPVVDRLRVALAAARQMLDTLLDVSLLDAGVVRREDRDFPAEAAGQALVEMFEPVAARKGLALGLRCPPDLWLHSDPALVQRVLVNLVGNAVKYTERGAVLLSFRRHRGACRVQVWDTGIGIAAADLAGVFDEFTQLGNPERDRTRGTGLGLTIVRRLCRLLGTEATVRSVPGRGSVFGFTLPLGEPPAPCLPAPSVSMGHAVATLLVVDDDALVRDALVALLSRQGYRVRAAANVDEAGRQAALQPLPKLAVVDHRLPGGATAGDAIRAIHAAAGPEVAVVLVTGDTHPQRIRDAQALGYPVLFKPVPAERLLRAVSEALRRIAV
jgi:signal transduction histidine kinase/CheY-like chemotaxis protein